MLIASSLKRLRALADSEREGFSPGVEANHAGEFAMKSNFRNIMVIAAIAMLTAGAAGCKRTDNSSGAATGADSAGAMSGPAGAMSGPSAASGGAAAGGMSKAPSGEAASGASQ
jgi:hypothetical protein